MKIFRIMLCVAAVVSLCGGAFAAGISVKDNYGKEIRQMQEKEYKDLRRLNKYNHERINWDKEMRLSEPQKKYMRDVLRESRSKIDEQMAIISRAHAEIDLIYARDDAKMRRVMTPEQQLDFDKIMYKLKKAHGEEPAEKKPSSKKMKLL